MVTISLCMIVKNEEAVLARCLESVGAAVDEIIIVDTGSTDGTKAVARRFTDKIYDFSWNEDFGAARNEAFSKATMDYQMWLDADDVFPEDELRKLLDLKATLDPATDMVAMRYITHFDASGNPILISTRERMMRRDKNFTWNDPIHEYIPLTGNVFYADIYVHHKQPLKEGRSDRNITIYNAMEAQGKLVTPRHQYYYARELKDHAHWGKSVYYFEKFLDGGKGWVEDNIASCYNLSICYRILGDTKKILPILTKSFQFDAPRAEICSEIGYYYKRARNLRTALKWFKFASELGEPESAGFILRDYWGYIPNIEACVCAYELGDFASAKRYVERAAEYKPDATPVAINRRALEGKA